MTRSQVELKNLNSKRGYASVMCLYIVCVLMVLGSALALEVMNRTRTVRKSLDHDRALCLAEAGADYGASNLKTNSSYTGTAGQINYGDGTFSVTVAGSPQVITSVGRLSSGATATIQLTIASGAYWSPGNGCLISNGDISMQNSGSTFTTPSGTHVASARCNGNFSGSGNIRVDGSAQAHGTVTMSGSWTINDPTYPNGQQGAPLIAFPTATQISNWQSSLISKAQAGGTQAAITLGSNGNLTLNTSTYVNGNITMTRNAILNMNAPAGSVIYVNGNISLAGNSSLTTNALIVCSGTFTQANGCVYNVSGNQSQAGLVSFATSSTAIQIVGGAAVSMQGLMYAVNGGIKLTNGGMFEGGMIAGGTGANGGIVVTGGASVYYPTNMMTDQQVIPGGFALGSWIEI